MDYKKELIRFARIAEEKGLVNTIEGLVKTNFIARAVGEPKKFDNDVYETLYWAAMYK